MEGFGVFSILEFEKKIETSKNHQKHFQPTTTKQSATTTKALQAEVKMYKDMYDRSREKALKESNALKEKYLKLKRQKE